MVKPLRRAFIVAVGLTEFHDDGYRMLSVWLGTCASDVPWYKPSRYKATTRGSWLGDAIESRL
jgi:hypothetical protein